MYTPKLNAFMALFCDAMIILSIFLLISKWNFIYILHIVTFAICDRIFTNRFIRAITQRGGKDIV